LIFYVKKIGYIRVLKYMKLFCTYKKKFRCVTQILESLISR